MKLWSEKVSMTSLTVMALSTGSSLFCLGNCLTEVYRGAMVDLTLDGREGSYFVSRSSICISVLFSCSSNMVYLECCSLNGFNAT